MSSCEIIVFISVIGLFIFALPFIAYFLTIYSYRNPDEDIVEILNNSIKNKDTWQKQRVQKPESCVYETQYVQKFHVGDDKYVTIMVKRIFGGYEIKILKYDQFSSWNTENWSTKIKTSHPVMKEFKVEIENFLAECEKEGSIQAFREKREALLQIGKKVEMRSKVEYEDIEIDTKKDSPSS